MRACVDRTLPARARTAPLLDRAALAEAPSAFGRRRGVRVSVACSVACCVARRLSAATSTGSHSTTGSRFARCEFRRSVRRAARLIRAQTRDADVPLAVRHFYNHAGWAQVGAARNSYFRSLMHAGACVNSSWKPKCRATRRSESSRRSSRGTFRCSCWRGRCRGRGCSACVSACAPAGSGCARAGYGEHPRDQAGAVDAPFGMAVCRDLR